MTIQQCRRRLRVSQVRDLMAAASAPRLPIRRDTETDRTDDGRSFTYERIFLQAGTRQIQLVSEDQLGEFLHRVSILRRPRKNPS